jgi:hypothetical protein
MESNMPALRSWLDRGLSEKPLMLHGTSIESVLETAKTGVMPTGMLWDGDCKNSETVGRLHFSKSSIGLKAAIRESEYYAKKSGFSNYIYASIGAATPYLQGFMQYWESKEETCMKSRQLYKKLREDTGSDISWGRFIALEKNARKRRGVIIEPNPSILELPHYPVSEYSDVVIKCPFGLDKKYIIGVKLLGEVEKSLTERFLDGKLSYKGFKMAPGF